MDIATGIGELVVTAAEVVGDSTTTTNGDSHILAIDISPQCWQLQREDLCFYDAKA